MGTPLREPCGLLTHSSRSLPNFPLYVTERFSVVVRVTAVFEFIVPVMVIV